MTSVSVAVATYNGARFLRQQLESIVGQEPPPREVVVSDDGSTDETLSIIGEVAKAHPSVPIRVLQGGHLGVSGNFERAMRATTGDLVALSDQDDLWHAGRLSAILAEFDADPELLLVHHDAELVDQAGAPLGRRLFADLRMRAQERSRIIEGNAFAAYIRRNLATGATIVFRRSLLEQALPIPAGWLHDEWVAIVAAAVGKVRLIDEALISYRQHDTNQVGVARPTLSYLVRRMLAPRGSRYLDLAARSAELVARLEQVAADSKWRNLAIAKAGFEAARARYPRRRFARIPALLRQARNYRALSSQGSMDLARDLMQSA